ncbi:MAG: hypothetical protein ACOYM8_05160 [Caulobacterales bacterium]
MNQAPPPASPPPPLGDRLFGWTASPIVASAFVIGLFMSVVGLVALEALVPRQSAGGGFDGRPGIFAGLGLLVALGLAVIPAALRRLPALRAPEPVEGDHADQP